MTRRNLSNAKLVVRVEGNKHTKEIVTKDVFDNRTQEYWTFECIHERGIERFLDVQNMKESLNWNLNGDSSKFYFKWGQSDKEHTEGVAYIFQ